MDIRLIAALIQAATTIMAAMLVYRFALRQIGVQARIEHQRWRATTRSEAYAGALAAMHNTEAVFAHALRTQKRGLSWSGRHPYPRND